MSDNPLGRMAAHNRVSIRAVLVEEGQDPGPRALGMNRDVFRRKIHSLKDAVGLGPKDDVDIDPGTGDATFGGEPIGNIVDE